MRPRDQRELRERAHAVIELAGGRGDGTASMRMRAIQRMRAHTVSAEGDFPLAATHVHVRDAASQLARGNTEGAKRHLQAAMHTLTPLSLYRNGFTDDASHMTAKRHMDEVHRHYLHVRDIEDAQAAYRQRREEANDSGPRDLPAQKIGGESALSNTMEFAGPKGYVHGWIKESGKTPSPAPAPSELQHHIETAHGTGRLLDTRGRPRTAGTAELTAMHEAMHSSRPNQSHVHSSKTKPAMTHEEYKRQREIRDFIAMASAPPFTAAQKRTLGLSNTLDLVGPKGWEHNWHFVGVPGTSASYDSVMSHPQIGKLGSHDRAVLMYHLQRARSAAAGGDHTGAEMYLNDARRRAFRTGTAPGLVRALSVLHDYHEKQATQEIGATPRYSQRSLEQVISRIPRNRSAPQEIPTRQAMPYVLSNPVDLSAKTAGLAVTPAPLGKPGGPGLYHVQGNKHSDYMEQVVKALIEKRGMSKERAYRIAWGALRKWRRGGGKVHPEVRAAAGGALAEEAAASAKAAGHSNAGGGLELAGFNPAEARSATGTWTSGGAGAATQTAQMAVLTGKGGATKQQILQMAAGDRKQAAALKAQIAALIAQRKAAHAAKGTKGSKAPAKAAAKPGTATASTKKAAPVKPGAAGAGGTGKAAAGKGKAAGASLAHQISQLKTQMNLLNAEAAALEQRASTM